MAEIKDCIGKKIKIGKTSITIKNDNGKTCGVVRGVTSLADMQFNKQAEYSRVLRKNGLLGNETNMKDIIVSDGKMYCFRNAYTKEFYEKFHEKYGYIDDADREQCERMEITYKKFQDAGIDVIEYYK